MPADLATLSALKARVEAETGPDHGLWLKIVLALLDPAGTGEPALRLGRLMMSGGPSLFGDGTESIDTALALVERALPGFGYEIIKFDDPKRGVQVEVGGGDAEGLATAATAPLAILSALLTAKIAQLEEASHAR